MRITFAMLTLLAAAPVAAEPPVREGREIVREFVAAFDRHDVDGVVALAHPEIAWMSVEGDSLAPQLKGTAELRGWLTGYFESSPKARSRLVEVGSGIRYFSAKECASSGKEGATEQCSHSVYELEQAKVRRVWYFPSEAPAP